MATAPSCYGSRKSAARSSNASPRPSAQLAVAQTHGAALEQRVVSTPICVPRVISEQRDEFEQRHAALQAEQQALEERLAAAESQRRASEQQLAALQREQADTNAAAAAAADALQQALDAERAGKAQVAEEAEQRTAELSQMHAEVRTLAHAHRAARVVAEATRQRIVRTHKTDRPADDAERIGDGADRGAAGDAAPARRTYRGTRAQAARTRRRRCRSPIRVATRSSDCSPNKSRRINCCRRSSTNATATSRRRRRTTT